jgi:hypothetical protein
MPHPQRFTGESVVLWSDLDITISVPWYLGLMFRTRKEDGVLMEATAGTSSRLHLQVSVSSKHTGTCRADKCSRRRTRQRGFPRLPGKGIRYSSPRSYACPIVGRENAEGNMGDPRCSAIVPFRIGVVQSSCITMGSCGLPFQHPLAFTTVTEWSIEPQSCWVCVTCPRQKLWSACLEFGWFLFLFLFFWFFFVFFFLA